MNLNVNTNSFGKESQASASGTLSAVPLLDKLKTPFQETGWRWVALLLMNISILGSYTVFDMPQPLETHIKQDFKIGETQYSLLYSVWAVPSIIVPFFGGYLTDKIGANKSLLLFSIAVSVGQAVCAISCYFLNFYGLLAGRAIYSLGTDPLAIAVTVMTNKWFQGKEVALAMSLATMTFGVARAINSALTPIFYNFSGQIFTPMIFGFGLCLFGTLGTILLGYLDQANDDRVQSINSQLIVEPQESENIKLSDVKHFNTITWLVIFNFGLISGYFTSFNAFTNDFYYRVYNFPNEQAGIIIAVNFAVTALSSILFGKIVDSYGYKASLMMYSSIFGVLGFIYYFLFPSCSRCISSAIPQVFFGLLIGISEAACFPALPMVLEEVYLGTGYGLFFVLQNILIFVLPPAGAYLINISPDGQYKGYLFMLMFFFGWAAISMFESVGLFLLNRKRHGNVLEKTEVDEEYKNKVKISGIGRMEQHTEGEYKA